MDNFEFDSPYYICFKDQECLKSSLPTGVSYLNQQLIFENKEPIEIRIIYILQQDQQLTMTFQFEKNVQVDIIETKMLQKNASLKKIMNLKQNAIVHMFNENNSCHEGHISLKEEVYLQRDAVCHSGYAELSDGSVQGEYRYYLDGENADARVRMAILSKQQEKKNFEVLIQHNRPYTYGQMDNYGVVKDQGHLKIDGIGTITKGQRGSSSHQTNKIMVFDPSCVASANPYLYIDEYDVKASHAAAVGKMDEEHLYYLQSRGLTKKQAMQLITYGYLKPVIEVVDNDMLKAYFEKVLSKVGA